MCFDVRFSEEGGSLQPRMVNSLLIKNIPVSTVLLEIMVKKWHYNHYETRIVRLSPVARVCDLPLMLLGTFVEIFNRFE